MASLSFPAISLSAYSRHGGLAAFRTGRTNLTTGPATGGRRLFSLVVFSGRNPGHPYRNPNGIKAESIDKRERMVPPYDVLITGSTKGIGYAVAKEFLKAGDNVVICSRSDSAVESLRKEIGEQHAELQMNELKNVMVHNLSPGMVTTDLLMSGANTKQAKFFINILAEPPDVVTEYLVPCVRLVPSGQSMKPTGLKAYSQILSVLNSLICPSNDLSNT